VAELWFETLDAMNSGDPAVQQAAGDLLADEAGDEAQRLCDTTRPRAA